MKWKLEKIIQYKNEKNSNVLKKLCSKSKKNKEEFEKINNFLQMTYRDFLIKYYIEQFNKDFINNEAYKLLKSLGFFKISSKNNKTKNLELDVKEKELEYEAIKEAIEKGNMNILSNFNIKNIKSTKFSTKIPKKLSEKEKERRDEIRRLKEAEDLEQIQQKLFRQVKGRRKIEPLYNKKSLYANKDVFGSNIDKECEKILVKEEKHNKLKKNDLMKPNNIKINNNDINARRNYKIHCDKKEESDEEKDKRRKR